jgi:hypothetical protein
MPSSQEMLPRLSATIRSNDQVSAIFSTAGESRPIVVGIKGAIRGWRVDAIADGFVVLQRGGLSEVVRLSFGSQANASELPQATRIPAFPGPNF